MGRRQIAIATAMEVLELLGAGGLSQRAIARKSGISRGTVGTIAHGKWTGFARAARKVHSEVPVCGPFASPARRCDDCGLEVHLPFDRQPCLACRVRRVTARSGRTARPDRPEDFEPIKLELRDGDRDRFEQLFGADRRRQSDETPDPSNGNCGWRPVRVNFPGWQVWRLGCPDCGLPYFVIVKPEHPERILFAHERPQPYTTFPAASHCRSCRRAFLTVTAEEFKEILGREI